MSDFWTSDYATETAISDPKRKFRFMVEMTALASTPSGGASTSTVWFAKSVTKPSFQIATAEHKYLNHTFFYPGTVTWQDVTLTLVDPTSPDVAAIMGGLMGEDGAQYGVPSTVSVFTTMTKYSAVSALGSVIISQLDGSGAKLEEWNLMNAFVTEMKFGDLEYGADDLTELTITLKYDWATLTPYTIATDGTATAGDDLFGKLTT